MAILWLHVLCAIVFCQNYIFCSVFDHLLDDVEPCKAVCDKTYTLHTYPTEKHTDCCKRGCRLFSLLEFVNDGLHVNSTKDACMASCMEAYSHIDDRYACNIGCSSQVPFALKRHKEHPDLIKSSKDEKLPQNIRILTPFLYVHNIYSNMIDKVSRYMSISWSFYVQQDNGKLVVIRSEPDVFTEYLDSEEVYDYRVPSEGEANTELFDENLSLNKKLIDESMRYHKERHRTQYRLPIEDDVPPTDWLGCVSRKSGLPRWFLGLAIFLLAVVMVWLCFATTVTSPDHHIHSQKLSIYGDLEYLRDVQEKRPLKIQPGDEDSKLGVMPLKMQVQHV